MKKTPDKPGQTKTSCLASDDTGHSLQATFIRCRPQNMLSMTDFQVIAGLIRLRPPQQSVVNGILVTSLIPVWRMPWKVDVEEMASFCMFLRFATLVRWRTGGLRSHG